MLSLGSRSIIMTNWVYCLYSHDEKGKYMSSNHTVFKALPSSTNSPCGYIIILLSFQAVTQLELFGDMSTPPDITSPPVSMHWVWRPASFSFPSSVSWWQIYGLWVKEAAGGFQLGLFQLCDLGILTSNSKCQFPLLFFFLSNYDACSVLTNKWNHASAITDYHWGACHYAGQWKETGAGCGPCLQGVQGPPGNMGEKLHKTADEMRHLSSPAQNPHSGVVNPVKEASSPPNLSAPSCLIPLFPSFLPPFPLACRLLWASQEASDSQL